MNAERPTIWLWLLASVGALILVLPTLILLPMSFTDGSTLSFPPRGFSLRWYASFFASGQWITAALNSLGVAIATTVLSVVLGVPLAMSLARSRYRGIGAINGLVLGPAVVPGVIIAIGTFTTLTSLGLTRTPLGLTIAHTVLALPLVVITILASARTLDGTVERAAASLGAGRWSVFRHAVLPPLLPGIAVGAVYGFVSSWDEMIVSLFITGPTYTTLPVFMWNQVRNNSDPTTLAVSTMLVGMSTFALVAVFVVAAVRRKQKASRS